MTDAQKANPPPGYASADTPRTFDAVRPAALYVALALCAFLFVCEELLFRQPSAYLASSARPSRAASVALSFSAFPLAALSSWRLGAGFRALALAWLGLSLLSTASGFAWFFAFSRGRLFDAVAIIFPALILGALGIIASAGARTLGPPSAKLRAFEYWTNPFRLLLLCGAMGALAIMANQLGILRSGAALGMVLAVLAYWTLPLGRYLGQNFQSSLRAHSALALAIGFLALLASDKLVTFADLRTFPGQIVHISESARARYVFTTTQQNLQVYTGTLLRASTIDAHRYAECMVEPALAHANARTRVLILGAGDGLLETEVLRHPDVRELTVVTHDKHLAKLAQTSLPLSQFEQGALSSPKLRLIEAEPIVWLSEHERTFDIIIIDLRDPVSYSDGKNYTHYFYELVARRLAPQGVAVIQATSAFSSRQTFSSIVTTIQSTELIAKSYRCPIPTLGEWGFAIATHKPQRSIAKQPDTKSIGNLRYLTASTLENLFAIPPDSQVTQTAPQNRLHDQPVVELLHHERAPEH